jgi:TolB-like protein/DNA-binding winged helix-turn-helix (wHTH) protein
MEHTVRSARSYRFDTFTLDVRTGELTHAGMRTPLREQPLQLLLALLEQPGELVTREALVNRLWPAGTFVDFDRGLNKAVNHLREALGDSAEKPRFIETFPRKGYRFIAAVTRNDEALEASPPESAPRRTRLRARVIAAGAAIACLGILVGANVGGIRDWAAARWRSTPQISALAVIPLENLSRDTEQEYFADGITDALITNLAKVSNVRVTSRTSIIRYKGTKKSIRDIGRELNVDAVVEGTVTRSGNRIRITAQLIQVSTDMHLWAEAYERDVSEILAVQNEVATDIARRVSTMVRPLDQAQRVNPEAYGSYLKGRYFFNQYTNLGWQQSIDSFNRAIESDPSFAPAYSGLADAYIVAGAYGAIRGPEALARGKAAAAHALELDDKLASAHYALATAYAWYDWDWENAEKEFHRALELDPNDALGRNWHGGYLSLRGRHDEAVDEHERARELDPFSLIINANLARSLY